jgi:Fic family protein
MDSGVAKKPAKLAAKKAAKASAAPLRDDGESIALMEPMLVSEGSPARAKISELAFELSKASAAFRASLPAGLTAPLADLVRSMNCYYSNLIEGHNTHPIEIEKAIHNELSTDPKKRDLQLEAKAHIAVQRWIDEGHLDGQELTTAGLFEVHRQFTSLLPDDLLWVEDPKSGKRIRVVPGQQRHNDTKVGLHIAVSPGAIPRFMDRFEQVYSKLGKFERIIASGPMHHRLLWIHPFADGNGRVTRLMSYAALRSALDTGGLWSVSRGLARKVDEYKRHLADCDLQRRNDYDGRGHLSEEATLAFAEFFLNICLDQVSFMEGLMQPRILRDRILAWAADEVRYGNIPATSSKALDAILFKGSLPRSEVAGVIDQSDRSARNVTTALSKEGIIFSPGSRDDWQIAFPAKLAPRLMPGLFP